MDVGDDTDTLAQVLIDSLERVPKPGDSVDTPLGTMRVENMARRRITRVSIQLLPELIDAPEDEEG
jgi:CBS domain containing-hemolysin-like protein